jgi:hypothetical protein
MTPKHTPPTAAEYLDEFSNWNVGAGIVTMALFPLALPVIALLVVLALPLLAVGLVVALLAGLIVLPLRLVRALRGRRRLARTEPRDATAVQLDHIHAMASVHPERHRPVRATHV